ncbi:YncE family protein, partial [Devosia indica]
MIAQKRLAALSAALLLSTAGVQAAEYFNRIASFPVALNTPDVEETSSEIITVSEDGMTLIYSDSPAGGVGFIDITDPSMPEAAGFLALDGEPTTVVVDGEKIFVGVNTSESYVEPSGNLATIDLASQTVEASCELGGQPDSVARNADGSLIAVAIENERDED